MNILFITSQIRSRSGYGRVSFELINSLKKNNFVISVICSQQGDAIERIKQIEILPAPLRFKKSFFLAWFYVLKFLWHKKEIGDFDLIQCAVEEYSFFTFLLSKILNKKYILLMHGTYSVFFFQNKIFGFLQKIAYRGASRIICVSNYTKNKILNHIDLDNLSVIPNGVNLENFGKYLKSVSSENKGNVLMSLGAFKERKGFDVLIKALAIVIKDIPNMKCYIGGGADEGDSDYYNKIVNLTKSLNIASNIVFFKNVSDEYRKDLYKKAKVFALTLVSEEYNFDGFGVVYLEANAHGIPVVGVTGSGAEDAIKDGYSGFLADPKDINSIAEKITRLMQDGVLYREISENSLMWAKMMSWDNIIKEYIKIYENIISK